MWPFTLRVFPLSCCYLQNSLQFPEGVLQEWIFLLLGNLLYPSTYLNSFTFCSANVSVGDKEDRMMLSGLHTVADLFCCFCGQNVGWKYVSFLSWIQNNQQKSIFSSFDLIYCIYGWCQSSMVYEEPMNWLQTY